MKNNPENTYVAIMAGGIGSRFWPASRSNMPKQFLDILGVGKSLIRMTFERFLNLTNVENIFIVTNYLYKDLVKEHLPEIKDNQILSEPSRNNTGPCVAYTAFKLYALDPNSNFVVAPSDHIILKENSFINKIKLGLHYSQNNDVLVTLGITPTRPDTGYGYIHFGKESENGIHKVKKFVEKPNLERANQYINDGAYLWNAGIFIWRTEQILKAFKTYTPEIYNILSKGKNHYNTASEQDFINKFYPTTPSISVDYAIMENADNIYTIPADIGWSDLGTWNSLWTYNSKDKNKNVINHNNQAQLLSTQNCLIRLPKNKLAIIGGLEDYIIIDEDDILLVWPRNREQEIKAIVNSLPNKMR